MDPITISLIISGGGVVATATAAFVGVKVGLNGVKGDVTEIKKQVTDLNTKAYDHQGRITGLESKGE